MKTIWIVILSSTTAWLLCTLWDRRPIRIHSDLRPGHTNNTTVVRSVRIPWADASASARGSHPSTQAASDSGVTNQAVAIPAEPFSWDRLRNDPDYELRVSNYLERRAYHQSPAKDTPECQAVRELLAKENLGIEAVREAYNALWENRQFEREKSVATREEILQIEDFQELFRKQAEGKLAYRFGITNQAFFDRLFEIRPKVFFGQRDRQLSEGENISNYQ